MWSTAATMEPKVPDLYEFLAEAELQQYYNSLKNELKITNVTHLKYATDEDLRQVSGLSRPEIRRLRKFYDKYYPHGYLNKIRRLLQPPRKDENSASSPTSGLEPLKMCPSPSKLPNNKHIIPPDAICVNKQLGTGEFGIVQQGVWTNGSERIQVAIKCLCRERMQSNPMEFLKEAAMMHSIEHENIVRLYGVVLDTESLMLVTELAHLRSLLECLKDPGLRVSFLTVPTLCEFSAQICNGMMYLENKRFIHRDLAARNILVFSKNKVKISDFGLSRALGVGKDYYQTNFNVNLKLPIAWCAPECINFLRFTHASDVWAYGVCLWEIFSYGFQPWAALTGHQILEAIDEPHYQRLEKPECCPKEYYALMLKCWQHDALKRPKFSEIFAMLPDIKPEQLKTIVAFSEQKKDYLMYRQGEIITVLDKNNNAPYWKGVLNSGKTGLFNPANTVAYLDSLPSSVNRDSFCRTAERSSSKRKIRTDMISRPQDDLKHTGHVGIDGVSFGDVAFLSSPQNLPRQIVTPYKPSEDLEQTPLLLPPTPTSPDSIQTASGYFSETLQLAGHQSFINAGENNHHIIDHHTGGAGGAGGNAVDSMTTSAFDFRNSGFRDSNPFINADDNADGSAGVAASSRDGQNQHEYHEISDDDMVTEKVFDQGPSLMDEMEHVFKSMSTISEQGVPLSPDAENTNMRNELAELSSKMSRKNSSSTSSGTIGNKNGGKSKAKKTSTVKPISMKDEKLLNQVIEMANEISAKSMTDLVTDASHQTSSPKRKFSFRFPHIHNVVGGDGMRGASHSNITGSHSNASGLSAGMSSASHAGRGLAQDKEHGVMSSAGSHHHPHSSNTLANSYREKRNFSQEVNNVPDLQRYRSLTGIERCQYSDIKIPLFDKETSDFCFKKSRELLSKQPFQSFTADISNGGGSKTLDKKTRDLIGENLLDIEKTLNALNLDFLQTYHELEKADSAETLFVECYSSMMCASSSPFQKSPPSGSLMRNSSIESSNSRGANCALSEKGSSGSSSLTGKSPPSIHLAGGGNNGGSMPATGPAAAAAAAAAAGGGGSGGRCYSELNGTSPKPTLQQDHNNKYGIRDFKFRSFDARPKERSDYYNFKNEYLSELTRKQQSQVLGSASVLQQTAAAGSKQQQQHKISQLYQIYNTPMQGRKYEDNPSPVGAISSSSSVRQRSLSFTENYEFKPSVVAANSGTIGKPKNDFQQLPAPPPAAVVPVRNVITYKPRSIRARNLRRLSYNPINMVDSSSSSSESEFDRNLAHSECDIRTRLHTTASRRRRHQYMTRKSNSNSASSQDKLYGSNASIKSAPQYNYHSDRRQYYNQFQNPSYPYGDDFGAGDNDEEDESIYDYGLRHATRLQSEGKGPSSTSHALSTSAGTVAAVATGAQSGLMPATSPPAGSVALVGGGKFAVPEPPTNYTNKALEREYLYSEFDVTKLTGKSPTTQSYFPTAGAAAAGAAAGGPGKQQQQQLQQQQDQQATIIPVTAKTNPSTPNSAKSSTALGVHLQAQPQPGFQWPEKIHGAVVKHNDMLWRQQSAVQQQPVVPMYKSVGAKDKHAYSSDTSSTETDSIDFLRPVECLPIMPPSPAP